MKQESAAGLAGGEKWREAFGGIKFGAAMVRMCVKEASVQISTGLT